MDDTTNLIDALEHGHSSETNGHGDSSSRRYSNGAAKHRKATRPGEPKQNSAPPAAPAPPASERRAMALFCFEPADGPVGWQVSNTAAALARRGNDVHLFTRHPYPAPTDAGVKVHAVGAGETAGLLAQVDEFTSKATNAFLQQFPHGDHGVTLMGYEWSASPALSLLRGISNARTVLSLHSLERQRSDMTSELSRLIEEIEMTGLREAGSLWLHDRATADIARACVPDCAGRIVSAQAPFPAHHFNSVTDAGAIKARFDIGPVDPTILFVGDFSDPYGPDLLIKSMPAVLRNHPQARALLVGYGELYWPMKVYARYLLLEHAIRLPGNVEGQDMLDIVQAADMVILPSRTSTPWWPILAAWAAQRPVVASHEAAPALLEHDADCVRIYASPTSVVWGIERVLYDADFAKKIGAAGHQKLEQRFGWNAVAQQVEDLLQPQARS
jgi:glycosyltransferase involved in cell wall biosynthesis